MLSEILDIVIFGQFMTFLFDSCRIRGHQIEDEEFICSLVWLNLKVFLLLLLCFFWVESCTDVKSFVQIMLEVSAVDEESERDSGLFLKDAF